MRARVVQCGTRQGSGPQDPPHKRMPQQAAKPSQRNQDDKGGKKRQNRETVVTLGENQLKNVFEFCYSGIPLHALEVRAAQAKTTFGKRSSTSSGPATF